MSQMLEPIRGALKAGVGWIISVTRPRTFEGENDLVRLIDDEYTRRRNERKPWSTQWLLNIAFLDGKQYMELNSATDDLREIPRLFWWNEREVFNHIAPHIETRMAKLGRMWPKMGVRQGPDAEDAAKARVTLALLDYIQQEKITPELRSELLSWLEACGTSFVYAAWDPRAGRKVGQAQVTALDSNPEGPREPAPPRPDSERGILTQAAETDARIIAAVDPPATVEITRTDAGAEGKATVALYEGNISPQVVPATEIFPDSPWRPNMSSVRSLIWARAMHVDDIAQQWGVRIEPEETAVWDMQKDVQVYGGLGYGVGGYHTAAKTMKDYGVVKQWFEAPSIGHPEGRYMAVAGHRLIFGPTKLLWNVGPAGTPAIPFSRFSCIDRPGCFWGRSIIERMIPIQRRYNALRNRKAEYMTRFAIGQLVVEKGSLPDLGDSEEDISAPGAIIEYKRGTINPPRYMEFHTWPQAFETEEGTLLNEFASISGVSETASRSQAPPGVKSGVALGIVLEQDNTRLSLTAGNIEAAHIDLSKKLLRIYKQYAAGPRLIEAVGSNRQDDIKDWEAGDICADDVIIVASALAADSPAQRIALVFDMLEGGLFNNEDTGRLDRAGKQRVFEMLQFGGDWERGNEMSDLQVQRAERENRKLAAGQPQQPERYDDDGLHVITHVKYMLQAKFEQTDEQSGGQLSAIFEQHMMAHVASEQEKIRATAPQVPTQGGTPQ